MSRLSALFVGRVKEPGMYADGGGLYLQVSRSGTKSWIFRYSLNGREREMGLGPQHTITLADARVMATEARRMKLSGIDPIDARKSQRQAKRLEDARAITFNQASIAYIKANRAAWKNPKHAAQWESTLTAYADPIFGDLPVAAIDTALVMKALEAIWSEKPETASRLRGRIESVLDWATARGYRTGENPARWRGHLDKMLPARAKVQAVQHHAALPYRDLPAFMSSLRVQPGIGALALEFAILTAGRTGEVIAATWDEMDLDAATWTVPKERMKAKREHKVFLGDRALAILRPLKAAARSDFVFPGNLPNKPLSNMAMLSTLKRMNRKDLTTHGFRSTFRDWAAETTDYPSEVVEMALAHVVANKVEAAYRRGDLFEKRKGLMRDWDQAATPR
ncbi:integrase arm-type DNA-binding domain-containing protein [Brevundimonas sp. 374]|uniref:tyrosine-type recombinase/integrase n=1 Tax=Brevundimonas sp. 374 TaxID=1150400 RepID=UPI000B8445E7|nr:integrase arm-type DNA-binding domain-containing protein [Brevundimonas sp. 374]